MTKIGAFEVRQIPLRNFIDIKNTVMESNPGRISFGRLPGVLYLEKPTISLGADMCYSGVVETMGGRLALFHKYDIDPGREIIDEVGVPLSGVVGLNTQAHELQSCERKFKSTNTVPFILRQPWFWQYLGSNINIAAYPDGQVFFSFGNIN